MFSVRLLLDRHLGHSQIQHTVRNKYREVPLNATVREVLLDYLPTVQGICLFISRKTKLAITTRALGYLVSKYARIANVEGYCQINGGVTGVAIVGIILP